MLDALSGMGRQKRRLSRTQLVSRFVDRTRRTKMEFLVSMTGRTDIEGNRTNLTTLHDL